MREAVPEKRGLGLDQAQRVVAQSPLAANAQVERASSLITTIRKKLSEGTLNMPIAPKVVLDLQRIMADPDQEMRHVVKVVEKDQELALRILHLSNSVTHAGRRPNRGLPDALVRVGLKAAYGLAVKVVTERFQSGIKDARLRILADRLWHRTCAVASAARIIAKKAKQQEPEDYYALSLLTEIGEPFLIRVMEDTLAGQLKRPTPAQIRAEIAKYHSSFGAVLLKRWGMDEETVLLTKMHHAPTKLRELFQRNRALGRQLYLLNLAHHAVELTELYKGDVDKAYAPPDEARARLQMTPGDLHHCVQQLKKEIEEDAETDLAG